MILNSHGSVITRMRKDEGKLVISNTQECGRLLDLNKHAQNEGVRNLDGIGKLIARVPVVIYHKWLDEAGISMQQWNAMGGRARQAFIKAKLNDPDYAYLKTTTRRV